MNEWRRDDWFCDCVAGECRGIEPRICAISGHRCALASSPSQPAGWKLVPIEPTENMLRAANKEKVRELDPYRGVYTKLWQAMLAAAPVNVEGK